MVNRFRRQACLALVFILFSLVVTAEVKPADKKKDKKDKKTDPAKVEPKDTPTAKDAKAATHKVEKGPFKVEVALKGVFESGEMTEVGLANLEAWTPQSGGILMVKKAIEHGTRVKKGEPLIWLDTEKIDQTIQDMKEERTLADLAIKQTEEEIPLLEKSLPVDVALAELAKKIADEDLKSFPNVQKVLSETSAETRVMIEKFFLDQAKDELKQLEKMYASKDLTESTEEIILKRQKKIVEIYTIDLKLVEMMRDLIIKVDLPRRERGLNDNVVKQTLNLEKTKVTLPTALSQKKLSLAKLKYEREKNAIRLAKLEKDRKVMTVAAPAEGIAYYGKCQRGQWAGASSVATQLQRGGMLQGQEVLITIVQPKPLFVRAVIEEKDFHYVQAGMKGKVEATSNADLKLPGKVEEVTPVPVTPGNFDAKVAIELGKDAGALMPGMACTVKFIPYKKEQTLTLPVASVFTEELDDEQHYVYLPGKDNKPEKHPVKIGKKTDKKIEILEGLKEGDEVLQEKPKPEAGK